jgi:hypothetical protein
VPFAVTQREPFFKAVDEDSFVIGDLATSSQ